MTTPTTTPLATFETSIDCGCLGELDCIVHYSFTPEQRGRYDGPPEDCFPDEPAEVDVGLLEWPCDSGYLAAQWEHLLDHVQEEIKQSIIEKEADERAEAFAIAHEYTYGGDNE